MPIQPNTDSNVAPSTAPSAASVANNNSHSGGFTLRTEPGLTLMLDIRLPTGDRIALPYMYLVSVEYEMETGLLVNFTSHQVLIKGRNLLPLYDGFLTQRVLYIQAEDPLHDTGPESVTFISAIEVDAMTE